MLSMWRDTAAMPEYGRLEGDVRTDVLVIGGGMAGILCAHFLRQAGMDCVLAEADRLCAGTTGNTTANSRPVFRLPPAAPETIPTRVGPPEQPRSPNRASRANTTPSHRFFIAF